MKHLLYTTSKQSTYAKVAGSVFVALVVTGIYFRENFHSIDLVSLAESSIITPPIERISFDREFVPFWKEKESSRISSESIIEATNKERIKQGFEPFRTSEYLNVSAKTKAIDMITRQYFEHDSPEGKAVSDLAHGAGYDYIIVGENLARGDFTSTDAIVEAWMESPGHRANILNTKYQDIGVYVATGTYDGKTVWFAVQHFGTERSVCPIIDSARKPVIDTMNRNLNIRRSQILEEKNILTGIHTLEDEEYKERVAAFNDLVSQYNSTLAAYQGQSAVYNAQVTRFNECLLTFK